MQRDYAYHTARHAEDLEDAGEIGRRAGIRAAARLNPVKLAAGKMAIIFEPRVASSLLGHFVAAINGASVARKASFLQERMGDQIVRARSDDQRRSAAPARTAVAPVRWRGTAGQRQAISSPTACSRPGSPTAPRRASSASSRPAMRCAGSAERRARGRATCISTPGTRSREELLAAFPNAILVTELIGQGVNGVTGDYSRGAAGFLVSGGEIGAPVAEITIASNLIEMFSTPRAGERPRLPPRDRRADGAGPRNDGGVSLALRVADLGDAQAAESRSWGSGP